MTELSSVVPTIFSVSSGRLRSVSRSDLSARSTPSKFNRTAYVCNEDLSVFEIYASQPRLKALSLPFGGGFGRPLIPLPHRPPWTVGAQSWCLHRDGRRPGDGVGLRGTKPVPRRTGRRRVTSSWDLVYGVGPNVKWEPTSNTAWGPETQRTQRRLEPRTWVSEKRDPVLRDPTHLSPPDPVSSTAPLKDQKTRKG